jgi:Cytochrome c
MKRFPVVLLAGILFASPAFATPPAQLYTLNCWGCHRSRAEGVPGSVPRLANSMAYFLYVPRGRAYLVQVPGVSASALTDSQVANVLNWLLHTFNSKELPRNFKPYTTAEVTKYRPHQLADVVTARAKLVRELAAKGIKVPDDSSRLKTADAAGTARTRAPGPGN